MLFGTPITQAASLPSDLIERHLFPYLSVRSLLRWSSCSKSCRSALSSSGGSSGDEAGKCASASSSIDELFWRERHVRRWTTSKAAPDDDNDGNKDDNLNVNDDDNNQKQPMPGRWHNSYRRRHLLDATVRRHLRSPHHGVSASKDPAWQYLLVDGGLDIVNRLYVFASSSKAAAEAAAGGYDEFAAEMGPIDDFERDVARSALVAINRMDVVARWQDLVVGGRRPAEAESESESGHHNIEDGAKLLARFYVGTRRVVEAFAGGTIHHLDDIIDASLDHLAHRLCLRLLKRCRNMDGSEALRRYGAVDARGRTSITLAAECEEDEGEGCPFSPRTILEEMQHLLRGTGGEPGPGLRGNAEDYYSYANSLLDQVLANGLGIPITLSVIYAAVVRRAVGVVLDPVGLPGHFVLGTPSSCANNNGRRLFIDVFRGGEILSLDDVRGIVARYRIPWDDAFLEAIPCADVWARMVNNLRACHQRNAILDLFNEQSPARRAMGNDGFTNLLRRVPPQELAELRYQHAMSLSVSMFVPGFIDRLDTKTMVFFVRPIFDRTICSR